MSKGKRYKKNPRILPYTPTSKMQHFRKFLILIFIICVVILIRKLGPKTDNISIDNIGYSNSIENTQNDNLASTGIIETERMKQLQELQKENSDIIGWLEIPDTKVNYPVLQGQDNKYYMTHTYNKKYSKEGSLFLDKAYDWALPSTNLLIYGHNNRGSTEMFVDLMNYKEEDFYKGHAKIRFTTATEDAEYEIISVFLSRVYYQTETDVFRYYYFINAANEAEFNEYVANCKKSSLYDIEATAEYGDQLITLSTCSYHTEDGRLAVVAKKISK